MFMALCDLMMKPVYIWITHFKNSLEFRKAIIDSFLSSLKNRNLISFSHAAPTRFHLPNCPFLAIIEKLMSEK